MYGKLFESMYDGTLVEQWEALITMQQLVILADENGVVDMTLTAISKRTNIPLKHIKRGIEILESPDPNSRTPDNEGRRIERLDDHRDWGWYLVNHAKYRDLRSGTDRKEYMREYMRKRRSKQQSANKANSKQVLGQLANTTTTSTTDKKDDHSANDPLSFDAVFWPAYPFKKSKKSAERAYKRLTKAQKAAAIAGLSTFEFKPDAQLHASTYCNQERWTDEVSTTASTGYDDAEQYL